MCLALIQGRRIASNMALLYVCNLSVINWRAGGAGVV